MKETIVWHKYPDKKPSRDGQYLTITRYSQTPRTDDHWDNGKFYMFPAEDYIAWAEMPKGYKD